MDAGEALLLVVPAMLLLLAAGGLAGYIENAIYQLYRGGGDGEDNAENQARMQGTYNQQRTEFARLRDEKARLEEDLAELMKERANLQGQQRRMADRQNNLVAEAGYPAPGTNGFYFRIEGPAAVMPFAGMASLPTAMGGKRRVRLVVWAGNMEAAQAIAMNWTGDDGRVIDAREFAGKLFWHEV
ncbi:hypothetical protein [Ferrovibrio terrae]|jgi:hypothetical protein|uniref:hypothetical protein n=1 Tax=Ferrovibrio terrae TaxID=2594003 RepID=UPI0031381FEC